MVETSAKANPHEAKVVQELALPWAAIVGDCGVD